MEYKDIGIIPEKEGNLTNRTFFLKTYFKICAPLFILFFVVFGFWKGLLASVTISFFASIIVIFVVEKLSSTTKILYGTTHANISVREQMMSTLETAKIAKMNKDFQMAIKIVNEILEKDPTFHDALFVKAQILHEGFRNTDSAKKYLKRIVEQAKSGQKIHTWASSLYDQLDKNSV